MRAVVYGRTGAARDVLRVVDVERPEPGPGEVRVRVAVSGVNPTDVKARGGAVPRPIDGFQIPHQDGVGEIDAIGHGVEQGRLGERVWVWFAALATRAGAQLVVNYKDPDAIDQIRSFAAQVDRVVEVNLGVNLPLDLALAGPGTTVVSYASSGADPTLPMRACMAANVTLRFVSIYGVPAQALQVSATKITAALGAGALSELPVHRFTLEDIVAAHEAVESGVTGKVLVDIG